MTDPIDTDAVRHADVIEKGIDRARSVLADGDAAIAAHLLSGVLKITSDDLDETP